MAADLPTRDELRQGMTVEVEQEHGDRIVGEIGAILSDEHTHLDGVLVTLKSGVLGRFEAVRTDL